MLMRHVTAFAFVLAASVAGAQEFQIVKVASVAGSAVDDLKSKTIVFNDHRADDTSDKGAFIHFEEWARTKPLQRQFLGQDFAAHTLGRWTAESAADIYAERFAALVGRPRIPVELLRAA